MLTRAYLSGARSAAIQALFATSVISAVGACVTLLQAGQVLPLAAWFQIAGLTVVVSLPIAVPVAVSFATVSTLAEWRRSGAWDGLRASGLGGRALGKSAMLLGGVAAALMALCTLWWSPVALHQVSEVVGANHSWPIQHPRNLGQVAVWAHGQQDGWGRDVVVAAPGRVLGAARARLGRADGELWLEALGATLLIDGPQPVRIQFAQGRLAMPGASPRLALAARGNTDLAGVARRTEAGGGEASYEWAVLYKRFTHVCMVCLLPVCLLPLGATRRPMMGLGCAGIVLVWAIRMGDLLAPTVGSALSAATGPVLTGLIGWVLWSRWRDR